MQDFSSGAPCRPGTVLLRVFGGLLLVVSAAAAVPGQPLELSEAQALAAVDQPRVAALEQAQRAALAAARAERELPDPRLVLGALNVPVTGEEPLRLDRDEMTMLGVGFMQEVVARSKRAAAAARMSAEAQLFAAEGEAARRLIRRDVALAWLDALEAQRRTERFAALAEEMAAERAVAAARLASSGAPGATELLRLDTELSMMRDRRLAAQRDAARARAELSRWIGEQAFRPLPARLPPDAPTASVAANERPSIGGHPLLEAAQHAVDVELREVERARADRRPDWSWQLMYGQRQDDRSDMLTLQLAVDLPWNPRDRQDRRVAEKLARAERARLELADRRRMLDAELHAVRAEIEASEARLAEHEERLRPAARARLEVAEGLYRAGRGPLTDVWAARRGLLESELEHDVIHIDRARGLQRLAYLLGAAEGTP